MEEIKKTLLVGLKPYTIVELEYVERDDEITFSTTLGNIFSIVICGSKR